MQLHSILLLVELLDTMLHCPFTEHCLTNMYGSLAPDATLSIKHIEGKKASMAATSWPCGCVRGGGVALPNTSPLCQHTYAWKERTKAPELLFLLLWEWQSSPFYLICNCVKVLQSELDKRVQAEERRGRRRHSSRQGLMIALTLSLNAN